MSLAEGTGALASPCIGVCRIDGATGLCEGCARTLEEIGAWRQFDEAARWEVWAALPARAALSGLPFHLWPWSGAALLARLAATVGRARWVWSIGGTTESGGLMLATDPGASLTVASRPPVLRLDQPGESLIIRAHPHARLFVWPGPGEAVRLVLGIHRSRVKESKASFLTELGPDLGAGRACEQNHTLFDLGLDRSPIRRCLRTGDPGLIERLRTEAGLPWPIVQPRLRSALRQAPTDVVILSPLGRIENRLRSDNGPVWLETGRNLERETDLPGAYCPCVTASFG